MKFRNLKEYCEYFDSKKYDTFINKIADCYFEIYAIENNQIIFKDIVKKSVDANALYYADELALYLHFASDNDFDVITCDDKLLYLFSKNDVVFGFAIISEIDVIDAIDELRRARNEKK